MSKNPGFAPSVGRMKPPTRNLRRDLADLKAVAVKTELDLHIVRLLELHPNLKVRFRNQDLASIDDATKQILLEDLNRVLGLRPLKRRKL
jgi:hypothetical protein